MGRRTLSNPLKGPSEHTEPTVTGGGRGEGREGKGKARRNREVRPAEEGKETGKGGG